MIELKLIWLWISGAVIVVTVAGAAWLGFDYGSSKAGKALADLKIEVAARDKKQTDDLNAANDRNRELELTHEKRITELQTKWNQKEGDERAADAAVISDLRNGGQRLRVQVTACTKSLAKASAAITAPSGTHGAGTAELSPKTATMLWSIAADGDRCARKLSGLQDWADAAVKLCNQGE